MEGWLLIAKILGAGTGALLFLTFVAREIEVTRYALEIIESARHEEGEAGVEEIIAERVA